MAAMSERKESEHLKQRREFAEGLARVDALLESARRHGERAQQLREQREELERRYFGRRFILIRF
jgi:hypothetical protein